MSLLISMTEPMRCALGTSAMINSKGERNAGSALKANWYKAGIQSASYAKLVCDGIKVDGGDIGGEVGSFHHNLLAHNAGRNWSMGGGLDGGTFRQIATSEQDLQSTAVAKRHTNNCEFSTPKGNPPSICPRDSFVWLD